MKLTCEVQVSNRSLPTLNLRKSGKPAFTQVSVGRKPGDNSENGQIYLMLCTHQNRNGTKYVLNSNVEQIFSRFVTEGKATIRLSNPADDISLSKADPHKLRHLLTLVKEASTGKFLSNKALSCLAPATARDIEKPVTSLTVIRPSEYPMSFPKSLRKLTINGCSLRRISSQVLALAELQVLDLSCNKISDIPDTIGHLTSLSCLVLPQNSISRFPRAVLQHDLQNSLVNLDLRENNIEFLPADIVKMTSLKLLNLSNNKLRRLPDATAYMKSLSCLFVANNLLQYLPGGLLTRHLEQADFCNNPFIDELPAELQQSNNNSFPVPTLAEWAGRCILKYSVPHTEEDLDAYSLAYLRKAHYCLCGCPCFEAVRVRLYKTSIPAFTCYIQGDMPFLMYYCSRTCYSRVR